MRPAFRVRRFAGVILSEVAAFLPAALWPAATKSKNLFGARQEGFFVTSFLRMTNPTLDLGRQAKATL